MKLLRWSDTDEAASPEPELQQSPWPGTGAAEPEPGAAGPGSGNHMVPRPAWAPEVIDGGRNQNQNQSGSGSQPGFRNRTGSGTSAEPVPGTSGSGDVIGVVLKSGARLVLELTVRFWRMLAGTALRLAETPGHPFHLVWHYQPPGSLAGHYAHAKGRSWIPEGKDRSGRPARIGEFQMHAVGRPLAFTGIALLVLAHSVRGQRIAAIAVILIAAAIGLLVA